MGSIEGLEFFILGELLKYMLLSLFGLGFLGSCSFQL